jgi:hypothetical protein
VDFAVPDSDEAVRRLGSTVENACARNAPTARTVTHARNSAFAYVADRVVHDLDFLSFFDLCGFPCSTDENTKP